MFKVYFEILLLLSWQVVHISLLNNMLFLYGAKNKTGIVPILCWASLTEGIVISLSGNIVHSNKMNWQLGIFMFVLLDSQINYELASMFPRPIWGGTPTQ